MSRIGNAFEKEHAFIGFLTAGDPGKEKTVEYILAMEEAGADLIEIGIPFSDPTAEGIVIQDANIRALKAGMTTEDVFDIVREVRKISQVPLVFLTYLNPVFRYGYEAFLGKCREVGVDGLIIPDLPFEEKGELAPIAEGHGIDLISLIAPTSEQRILKIAKEAAGFLYVVSSMGVTGMRQNFQTDLGRIVASIKSVTDVPTAIGFGINTPAQAEQMAAIADGVIVGSAIVKIIEEYGVDAREPLMKYVTEMKLAMKGIKQ